MFRVFLSALILAGLVGCDGDSQQGEPAPRTQPATATGPVQTAAPVATKPGLQSPEQVIRILQERLRKLENVIVVYKTHVTYPPLRPGEQAITRPEGRHFSIIRLTGTRDWVKGFLRLGDRFRYESKTVAIEGDPRGPDWWPDTTTQITTYTPDVSEYLGLDRDNKPTRGVINPPRRLPSPEIEIALGLRAHGQTDVLTPEALAGMLLTLPDDDTAVLRVADNENFTHEWTYLRAHGYALGRYHRIPPPGKAVHQEAVMSDFRDAGGMIMPYAMTLASKTIRGGKVERVNIKTEATVVRYLIGSDKNTPDRYRLRWPAGTRLFDRRKPSSRPASRPATVPATRPATAPAT